MGLAHDRDHRDLNKKEISHVGTDDVVERAHPARSPDRSRTELREERLLVVVRNRADDVDESRDASKAKLFRQLGAKLVERDRVVGVVRSDQLCSDRRGDS
jgi:hypothetical protein